MHVPLSTCDPLKYKMCNPILIQYVWENPSEYKGLLIGKARLVRLTFYRPIGKYTILKILNFFLAGTFNLSPADNFHKQFGPRLGPTERRS